MSIEVPANWKLPDSWTSRDPAENARLLELASRTASAALRGEDDVAEAIREFIPCDDRGGERGHRLLHFEAPGVQRRMDLLVAVDTSDVVHRETVDDFVWRVKTGANADTVNAAMFVALRAPVPYRMHTALETVEVPEHNKRVPVLWLSTASKHALQSGSLFMLRLFELEAREVLRRACEDHEDVSQDMEVVRSGLPGIVEFVDEQLSSIDENVKLLEQATSLAHSQRRALQKLAPACDRMKRQLHFLCNPMEEACRVYLDTIERKQKSHINLSDVPTTQRALISRVGGIARVKECLSGSEVR